MLFRLLNRFRPTTLRDQVEDSIRLGNGLRKGEWLLADGAPSAERVAGVGDEIVAWCREQIGGTRRPYGIDQLALAVACAEPGGEPIASATFGVFRPADFYSEGGVSERVVAFVRALPLEELQDVSALRFAAALFSWGDIARDNIYRDEAESD